VSTSDDDGDGDGDDDASPVSADRHRILSELSSDYAYELAVEPGGRVIPVWYNDAFVRRTGFTAADLRRGGMSQLLHPDDVPVIDAHMERVLAGRQDTAEHRILTRTGDVRWVRTTKRPVRGPDGRVARIYGACQDVTRTRAAEAEQRDAAVRFRGLADASPNLVWTVRPDGSAEWSNRRWDEYVGAALADAGPDAWAGVVHPDDRAAALARWRAGLAGGAPFEAEFRLRRHDGAYRWHLGRATPIRAVAGAVTLWCGTFTDVHDLRGADDRIRSSEERYRSFVAQSSEGIWRFEAGRPVPVGLPPAEQVERMYAHGYLAECNDAMARMYGFDSAAEVVGRRLDELLVRTDPRNEAYLRAFVESGYRLNGSESRELDRFGRERIFLNNLVGVIEDGRLVRAWGTQLDLTAQRHTEAELRRSRGVLQSVLDSAPGLIYLKDEQLRILLANRRYAELCGRPVSEIIGRTDRELFGDGDAARFEDNDRRVLAGNEAMQFEETLSLPDGVHTYLSIKLPVEHIGFPGRVLCGFTTDITDRKRIERDVRDARDAAERARHNAEAANRAKDQFLAVLSHELRTPLTPVLMAVTALESEPALPPEVRRDLEMIRRNIELETKLIDDLLDVTRIVNGKLRLQARPCDAHGLLRNVLEMLRADAAAKRLAVTCDLAAGDAELAGDAARLQQVFWNLVKNAIKFSRPGGHLAVRTSNPRVTELRVEVVDDGVGIDAAVLPSIFTAFEQGDPGITRQFGGLGLGLTISKALVELHGGQIHVHSEGRGRGARFTVELPTVGTVSRIADRIQPAPGAGRPPPGLRVLIVDDHDDTLGLLKRLMERLGHVVHTAGSIAAAVTVFESLTAGVAGAGGGRPPGGDGRAGVDVIVCDIGLPDGTGHDLMRHIRAAGRDVPGVAVSGYGMDHDLKASQAAGFAAHLVKPIDVHQLDATLRDLVARPAVTSTPGPAPASQAG
jgi:PAS domain S-box-containing protein